MRLDVRGSGDSDGLLLDEYAMQEQDDAVEAIAWIASQPWCSGAVGMIGKSWGGFNGLQVAARRPPALKAVVTVYSTDDRYADDAHYMGGCLLTDEMLGWGTTMHTVATLPPDPKSVGEAWKKMWQERLDAFHPQIHTWLTHQRRDDYWKHGSVNEDFGAITCAVYAVGGWCDGYRDAVFRLMEGLSSPKKALIGPWSHEYAMDPFEPGPHIGFLQECIRFFDQWLKGEETGIMEEPTLARLAPGRRRAGDPLPRAAGPLGRRASVAVSERLVAPHVPERRRPGRRGGRRAPARVPRCAGGRPGCRRLVRVRESARRPAGPARRRRSCALLHLGTAHRAARDPRPPGRQPGALLRSASALVVVRLCDINETGESTLITRGLLNLTHRNSHEHPEPLVPGERTEVSVFLQSIGQMVPAGHRLRVAISPTYFPWAWPSPVPVTLTLFSGVSSIELPLRLSGKLDEGLRPFDPPEIAAEDRDRGVAGSGKRGRAHQGPP